MAEKEIKFIKIAENLYLNGQINQAKEELLNGLKVYPENRAMQYLLQQYQDVTEHIQQENKEMKQTKTQNKRELNELTEKYNTEEEDEIKEKNNYITNISFQMRLKALIMELNAAKTYTLKELIANKNDTWEKIHTIETCIGIVHTALNLNNSEKAENELLKAESLSTELMRKIKSVVKIDVKKEKEKNPGEDIEVPDYRSIVTVRGTKEDVTMCILKAKAAFENGKYDRAENLLLKAERIFPTKNARDLLKQIQAAREPKQNSYPIEIATEAIEQVNTIKKEESKSECYDMNDSVSAVKCMTAFERAFSTGNFEKAERMLNKAKRFDPSIDVEQKLAQVIAAINNKIIEEKRKEEILEAKRKIEMAGECLYKSIKAYSAGDFVNAEQILLRAKTYDPMLNLDPELSTIRSKMTSKSSTENEDTDKTEPEETVTESDVKFAAEYLYGAKKAYDAGDFIKAERNLNGAKTFDFSLDLESLLSKCRAEIASRSSTKGNKDIPKVRTDTMTTYPIKHIELCNYYFKEAEIAYQNRNLNETTRLLTLAKTYHPCTKVNEMLQHVEKLKEKKQTMLSHGITASETEFSFSVDEKEKEMDVQIERRRKEVVKKGKSCMKKYEQPEIKKSCEDRENSQANKKSITNKQGKNVLVKYKSNKKDDKEENLKTKLSLEDEEVKNLISMAQIAINNKKFNEAINVLNTAEELYPTEQAKELLKTVSEIVSSCKETFVYSNCYEFAVEANESDETEALKCIKIAQAAFQESQYDRAEHFLLKSLRIWDNHRAKSFLETVLHAKAQYNTKVTVDKENNGNEHVNKQFLYEYNKCVDLTSKAIIEGNLAIAERFLSKAIRINPNDNDRKHLKHIQDVRELQYTSDKATTSKTVDDDLKREIDAETYINWAVDAMSNSMFHVARHYFEWALEKRANEETREMLRYVQIYYSKGGHSRPINVIMSEANNLLDKADNLIRIGDLEKAESLLIVSWDMNRSELTTLVHKKFLETRLALFKTDTANKRDVKIYGNSEKIFESDRLVTLALEKYKNNKFVEAEELLKKAATLYPSVRINKLLAEIREVKNKGRGIIKKMYNYACNKLS